MLALIDIPDFGGALGRMARSLERIAGIPPCEGAGEVRDETSAATTPLEETQLPSRLKQKIAPVSTAS